MPELPDLVYIEKKLRLAVVNREIREHCFSLERGIDVKVRDHLYCPKCQHELRTHFVPWDKLS
jgi:formamidopyrimidine-DNA glycosylase